MLVASVIVDVSARALNRAFDYLVPHVLAGVRIGCAVSVEFGARPVVGYVVGLSDKQISDDVLARYKPLVGILSDPYFDETSVGLAFWISDEYVAPLSDSLRLFTPPGGTPKIKLVDGKWSLVRQGVGPVDDRWVALTDKGASYLPPSNAVRQMRVLEALKCGELRMAELALQVNGANATCKALEKKGLVRIDSRRRMRGAVNNTSSLDSHAFRKKLTAEQASALGAIEAAMRKVFDDWAGYASFGSYACAQNLQDNVVVIDGITGSGKTEVYLQAIDSCLAKGKDACVLVPEIALTPQTVGRFRSRFGDRVAVLHSRLSAGERFDQWDYVNSGAARVVVGTRSSLFAPLPNVGLVIIDEEHENSYKQDSTPRYDARRVALELCRRRGAALVLGSATPSIETLIRCQRDFGHGLWERVVLSKRPSGQPLPSVEVVDMGKEFGKGSRSMFSKKLQEGLLKTFAIGEKSVLLLNKRGFASFVLCRECGFVPECPHCSVSLTYHERGNVLRCHHCGYQINMMPECPNCKSPYLRKFGAGTQRVEDELACLLPPEAHIVRMDADTTAGKGAHERLLEEFASTPRAILLGTQMIAKGLDFPDVTLVGVINADTTLKLPDYRSSERTYQLLEQVSGRAGRGNVPGRVIIQTYCPMHPAVKAAANHERTILLKEELPARNELGYPPYRRLANILLWGKQEQEVRSAANELALALSSVMENTGRAWTLFGPAPCMLERIKGDSRWHILLKGQPEEDFGTVLGPLLAKRRGRKGVRIAVDVDPSSLL